MTRARVLLLTAALGPLDYRVPGGTDAPLGSVVVVPPVVVVVAAPPAPVVVPAPPAPVVVAAPPARASPAV